MGKKVYVNGGILVSTRNFSCINATCLCEDIPEGAEYIDPPIVDGEKCLVIDDEHPQSPFNEYFCKTFFTSLYMEINFFSNEIKDCYIEFSEGIEECRKLILLDITYENGVQWAFYKMVYLHAISCIDSLICSMVVSKIANNENLFIKYYKIMLPTHKKSDLIDYLIEGKREEWENEVMKVILHTSFCNINTIKDSFKCLDSTPPIEYKDLMENHFKIRHLLMHRNGKTFDGRQMELNRDIVKSAIEDVNNYGEYLVRCILTPRRNSNKNQKTQKEG